ncbi:MAG TPA: PKD domain-containing protein [Vicinamibacterales bacterium]|nr:PKD domain-containing protein [Vicinamibacterales bacterium]
MTRLRGFAALVAAVFLAGCMMQSQSAPPLGGPSGMAKLLTLIPREDILQRDGSSQTIIDVEYTDTATNQPIANVRLILSATSGTLSVPEVRTDAAGRASFVYVAPSANTPVTSATISATPVGNNVDNTVSQGVRIGLVGPEVPTASFTFSPSAPALGGSVTFDASGSRLNGAACGPVCSYEWDFGDGTTGTGQLAQHTFQTTGVHTVTLTVTAPGGTSNSTSRSFAIAPPSAPVAAFAVSPSSPVATQQAIFDATTSSVGAGATIVSYAFNFGNGDTASSGVPIVPYTYPMPGAFVVSLTVTDSLGRSASVNVAVTVVP